MGHSFSKTALWPLFIRARRYAPRRISVCQDDGPFGAVKLNINLKIIVCLVLFNTIFDKHVFRILRNMRLAH